MIAETIPQLGDLNPEQKLTLIGELWDQLLDNPEALPCPQEHLDLVEARLRAHRENPEEVTSWEDIKARILDGRTR